MGRKKLADERRQQILAGLFHTIIRKGYANCTITEISEAAGVSRGILHYYFKNKDEMLLELMISLGKTHYEGLLAVIAETDDVMEKLVNIVRFHYMDESAHFHRTAGVWVEFWGQVPSDPQVRGVVRKNQKRIRKLVSDLIQEGIDNGVFRPVDPRNAAAVILSMMVGPTLQWTVDRRAIKIREVSRTLEEYMIRYLQDPSSGKGGVSKDNGTRAIREMGG